MEKIKNSFVFHFDYLADIPEELRTDWTMKIINYAQFGTVPQFDDWRDVKSWNAIKKRMDDERAKYEKKTANLRQNKNKVYDFIDNSLSDTDKILSVTDKKTSDTENELSDTDEEFKNSIGDRRENIKTPSAGEFVNVNEFEFVNEFVNCAEAAETNQPTTETNIFNKLPFYLDRKTKEKIITSLINANIEPTADVINYAFSVVSSKKYGPEKTPFKNKNEQEQKALFVSALLKYPGDIFANWEKDKKKAQEKEERQRLRALEEAARASPPKDCKCGAALIPKGSGLMCFNCRRTYEIKKGKWEVNE